MDKTRRQPVDKTKRHEPPTTKNTRMPPAGPHAKPELIDREKTPASGVLPEPDVKQTEAPTG